MLWQEILLYSGSASLSCPVTALEKHDTEGPGRSHLRKSSIPIARVQNQRDPIPKNSVGILNWADGRISGESGDLRYR